MTQQALEAVPVLFRAERSGEYKGEVTAVLPSLPANPGNYVCYAHIGQHCEGSIGWYHRTCPATAEESADLLKELRGIYETGPDAVRLVVRKRIQRRRY